ncbi:holocarboxylase synthetase-like protein isoform X1 [Cotesia typhae]|uniref:holocarboxylase synthetase-like protein isoform X1 n=1 Tax=Cotesia typhae TaxID=2053667 RepID=UPI003D69B542
MLLTFIYMILTWARARRLTPLRTYLFRVLNNSNNNNLQNYVKPSLMCHIKSSDSSKPADVNSKQTDSETSHDLLTSHLCSNKNTAKLYKLIWSVGDNKLCIIIPQQKIDVSEWLVYPPGKTNFPLSVNNLNQTKLADDSKVHLLIEADINNFNPSAFTRTIKLEDYGLLLSWTADKLFAAIMETDIDHMSKLSIALMESFCFFNNGLLLTRIESVQVSGKPCSYNINQSSLWNKKLVGKAQWKTHMETLKLFSSTARRVSQQKEPFEVDTLPGIIVSPGTRSLSLQMPTVLEINHQQDTLEAQEFKTEDSTSVPKTPPPTPASLSMMDRSDSVRQSLQMSSNELHTTLSRNSETPDHQLSVANSNYSSTQNIDKDEPKETESRASSDANLCERILPKTFKGDPFDTSYTNRAEKYSEKRKFQNYPETGKPPNVLIYADSTLASDNIERVLKQTLNKEKYIIYKLTPEDARRDVWKDQANLVVVCGNVDSEIASQLVNYIVEGGKLLALCSDALHILLPSFKTAEVREHELVRFSYGKWKNVQMMHHIFCYQASPIKSRFSQDHEDVKTTPVTPASSTVKDKQGKTHTFQVRVLGAEETWHTPSIVLADLPTTGGKALFSQIHLEADPSQYEMEEAKFNALKASHPARLEILSDLLGSHLGVDVKPVASGDVAFNPGFFLGRHELKLEMLERLKDKMESNDIFKTNKIKLQFCNNTNKLVPPSSSILPIMLHTCPDNFSTIEYFENLKTKDFGRLVIYADIMTSSMDVVAGCKLHHGLAVIPRQQTQGQGRSKNVWLSAKGCLMFTLQLHIPLNSYLGNHLPILQHIVVVAVIAAVKSIPGYEEIDLNIKWPNDIYLGDKVKLGGLIVPTLLESSEAICNIGLGVNLSNSTPTSSINEAIKKYNEKKGTNLAPLGYEKLLALIFNQLESLINSIQNDNVNHFYQIYYDYWLHTDTQVSFESPDGAIREVKILGIDSNGYLEVQSLDGKVFSLQPDGNSFDIFKGLIAPSLSR